MIKKLIFSIIFILFAVNASATTYYYIDSAAADDTANGTTRLTPWKHAPGMTGCASNCAGHTPTAADVFVFKGGDTWTDAGAGRVLYINNSGSSGAGNTITYMGGQQCGYTAPSPFYLNGSSACNGTNIPCGSVNSLPCDGQGQWGTGYPHFDGGAVNGEVVINMNAELSYVTIDGIEIDNAGYTDGSGNGIFANTTSSLEVKNNILNTNAIDAFDHVIGYNKAHLLFHDNLIENSGRVVINTSDLTYYMDDIQLYNNIFLGLGTYNPHTFHSDGFMVGANVTPANGNWMTNLYIHHNIFRGNMNGTAAIYVNGVNGYNSVNGAWIYDNVIAPESNTCTSAAFSNAIEIYNGYKENINIFNNTISGDNCSSNPAVAYSGISLYTVAGAIVENNILSGVDNAIQIGSDSTGTITVDYNIYNTVSGNHLIYDKRTGQNRCNSIVSCQAQGEEAHGINNSSGYTSNYMNFMVDPAKIGGVTGAGNWQLTSSSPAKDVGLSQAGTFTTDYLLKTISNWGMGAYNYEADSGSTFTLSVNSPHGTITDSLSHIDCVDNTGVCSYNYAAAANPVLTATPDSGYNFTPGWSGTGDASTCTGTGTCSVTISAGGTATATYTSITVNPYNITVSQISLGGTLAVTGANSNNSYGINPTATNGTLTVTATKYNGWKNPTWVTTGTGTWTGCTTGLTCKVANPTSDGSITATFTEIPILPWH